MARHLRKPKILVELVGGPFCGAHVQASERTVIHHDKAKGRIFIYTQRAATKFFDLLATKACPLGSEKYRLN